MLQEKEEQLLKKRMIELAGLCYQRDIQTSTGFLSLNEQTIFHSIEKTLPPVRTCLTGGFEGAERKLLCFLASYDDEKFGHSEKRELAFLTAHSMMHLFGYDHMTPEESAVMEAKQNEVLERLGITR